MVIVSESNKLTSHRHYHDRDRKALKFFIAFITCVVWLNSSSSKLPCFIRILDVLYTAMSAYLNYWWVWNTLTILQFLTPVGTWSLILAISATCTPLQSESTRFNTSESCLIMYLRVFYVCSPDVSSSWNSLMPLMQVQVLVGVHHTLSNLSRTYWCITVRSWLPFPSSCPSFALSLACSLTYHNIAFTHDEFTSVSPFILVLVYCLQSNSIPVSKSVFCPILIVSYRSWFA